MNQKISYRKIFGIIFSFLTLLSYGQCPPGDITFNTQQQLTDFINQYPACTQINGNLVLSGENISNLSVLNNIISIENDVMIMNTNTLINLSGLHNLTTIGGTLWLVSNTNLTNLSELSALTTLEGGMYLSINPSLTSLSGLSNLTFFGGNQLWILHCYSLTNLSGLENISIPEGNTFDIHIGNNTSLTSLSGIENISPDFLNGLAIQNNTVLSVCNVPNVCEYLSDENNPRLIQNNLAGCNSDTEIINSCTMDIDIFQQGFVQVYPNPVKNELHIYSSKNIGKITILNSLGQIITEV